MNTPPAEDPKMVKVDLTEMMDAGVLMAANEEFFWPLGLALTWEVATGAVDTVNWCHDHNVHEPHDVPTYSMVGFEGHCAGTKLNGRARNLHITQWAFPDGHHETIEAGNDEVAARRREAFLAWVHGRAGQLPKDEREGALMLYGRALLRVDG